MDIVTLISSIIGSGGFVGVVTYFFTQSKTKQEVRKLKAEAQNEELDNVLKMQTIIEKINEPLKQEVAQLRKEVNELKLQLEAKDKENMELKKSSCTNVDCTKRQ